MERFAFKIDKVLKANLYRICRLCGIDNPEKVPILKNGAEADVVDVDAEPELSQKIKDLIGIAVYKDDKMPQYVCTLCVDKINDFYEFREMCFSTDAQTRKLLGIKNAPKKNPQIKVEVKTEAPLTDKIEKRGRKRKLEEVGETRKEVKEEVEKSTSAKTVVVNKKKMKLSFTKQKAQVQTVTESAEKVKSEVKDEPVFEAPAKANAAKTNAPKDADVTAAKSSDLALESSQKLKQLCAICKKRFATKAKVERHRIDEHNPTIPRHFCTTCDEEVKKSNDFKSHQLWHKLTKTPHICGLCGETLLTVNLYTRHLSNHSQKLATPLMIFDRECSQCHETFVTNFLYNTHPCAIRTKKCGGCNRKMPTETEYQRHAASCDKAYLVPSKHIGGIVEAVRIKNENDVEAAAEGLNLNIPVPLTMMPVVSLTRLSIEPQKTLNKANTSATTSKSKKGGKKGISKKDLKRVDDLLKSTMDTLVSIKHEPEINVDAEHQSLTPQPKVPSIAGVSMEDDDGNHDDFQNHDDDFQNQDDDSNQSFLNASLTPIVQMQTGDEINIKQEPREVNQEPKEKSIGTNVVNVKKELPDSAYEDTTGTKVPVLKLKITKEHGTLNSSLVNNSTELREKKKKKKKRKDAERCLEQAESSNHTTTLTTLTTTPENSTTNVSATAQMPLPGILHVKQERLDDGYYDGDAVTESTSTQQPEATIMTSIPIMQLQIANVSCGVEFEQLDAGREKETELDEQTEQQIEQQLEEQDVKPNVNELERLLARNISQEMQEVDEEMDKEAEEELYNASNTMPSKLHTKKQRQQPDKPISKRVATKSCSKRPNANVKSHIEQMPKIVAISSGVDMASVAKDNDNENENESASEQYSTATSETFTAVRIKAEPRDDEYYEQNNETPAEPMDYENDNETTTEGETDENMACENAAISTLNNTIDNDNINEADEQAYINSIDFSNIKIKEEKDIDVSESQLTAQNYNGTISNILINNNDGSTLAPHENESATEGEDDDDDEAESDEEDEDEDEDQEMPAVEEKREYREIELPPLLDEAVNETMEISTPSEHNQPSLGPISSNEMPAIEEKREHRELQLPPLIDEAVNETMEIATPSIDIQPSLGPISSNEMATVEEKREYHDIELPPLIEEAVNETMEIATPIDIQPSLGLMISNVCSQVIETFTPTEANCEPQISEKIDKSTIDTQQETKTSAVFDLPQIEELPKIAPNASIPNEQPQAPLISDISIPHIVAAAHTDPVNDSLAIKSHAHANNSKDSVAINETATLTISGVITENAESSLKALPVLEKISNLTLTNDSNESHVTDSESQQLLTTSIDEEQQNILNHEMCESHSSSSTTNTTPTNTTLPTIAETLNVNSTSTSAQVESYLEDISSSSFSDFSNIGNENSTSCLKTRTPSAINEETENLLNENVDVTFDIRQHNDAGLNTSNANSQISATQQEQRALLLDNSNVNEIAENNNNANIERELLDDGSHHPHHSHNIQMENVNEILTLQESPPLGDDSSSTTASNAVEPQGNAEANA